MCKDDNVVCEDVEKLMKEMSAFLVRPILLCQIPKNIKKDANCTTKTNKDAGKYFNENDDEIKYVLIVSLPKKHKF